jgi:hypothetical protein
MLGIFLLASFCSFELWEASFGDLSSFFEAGSPKLDIFFG